MPDYILTYDIPNEQRTNLEDALTQVLHAKRERGVSTFWRFKADYSAAHIRDALKQHFPAIKLYVYEVNPANAASTELTLELMDELVKALRNYGK